MSSNTSESFKFCTCNCRGWKSGCDYVNDLLKSCDFCLIQEHWLFQDQFSTLNVCNDVYSVSVSGMSGDELILGRPYGGCMIFFTNHSPTQFPVLNLAQHASVHSCLNC